MLRLASDDVELVLDPWKGGSITAFRWKGRDIFRPHAGGNHPIDLASFPLVPFCNRIAQGLVMYGDEARTVPMSRLGVDPEHAIHGLGWISPWAVSEQADRSATLGLTYQGVMWPWSFEVQQQFRLLDNGYVHTLIVTNTDTSPMPAGLGLHPYFPREDAALEVDVGGYWETGPDRLPSGHCGLAGAPDWFDGAGFDNCFTGRTGPIEIRWPAHTLTITPSPNLPFTHVYSPSGEGYFCVEPVSHIPNAVNSALAGEVTGLKLLEPGEAFEIDCVFTLVEAR
ncbi:aldose 1-epimerase [Pontixanthobacter sp. CEM42]|uniref:aldose 1-epimerase n=1 Tax=Pontixanthobacter sp. CEM42 TaxID=2792077 RepID=UPI001ADFAEDD